MRALSRACPDDHLGGRDSRRGVGRAARAVAAFAAAGLLTAGVTVASTSPASAEPGDVVISQVYGGGGNSGAPYTNDYVELFNRGTAEISLDGWSLQYTSATGTGQFGSQKQNLSGSLAPGQYHLIQLSAGTTPSGPLPSPDTVGTLSLSATAGKVALVRSTTGLACNGGSSPCTPEQTAQIADLVGYGTANYFEGSAAAPGLSNSTAAVRAGGGCADTDDNAADFTAGTPAPRNTATPPAPCGGVSPSPSATPSAGPSASPSPSPSPSPTPTGDPCDVPANRQIAEVQGSGDASPLAGQTVRVEGIVTGDFQTTGQQSGFYFQDPTPDADPATSDGLFAFARDTLKDVKVGDRVLVTGRVTEFNGLTELSPVTAVDVCGTGTITPKAYDLPRAGDDTFEPYENVLVTFPEALTVTDHYNLGRYGEVTVAAGGRLFQPTDRKGVDPALDARRTLLVDDGSNTENPATIPYTSPEVVRLGDTAKGITGVLSYGFGAYRLEPTKPITFQRTNPRMPAPAPVGGNVRVASLNTLNWFTTLGSRGANTAEEQQRQLKKIVATLKGLNADVVGLMEVENNGQTAVDALVAALNAEVGAGTYAALTHPYPGTDAIHVAAIYKPAKVTPVGATRSSADPVFRRPPLIQTFRRVGGGQPFTLLVNHFKSKGCDAEAPSGDTDQGDGQGCYNAERVRQAKAVLGLIGSMDLPNPLVIGDLNAYGEEDPIHILEKGGLTSLSKRFVPEDQRYSYLFGGLSGELDHAMAGKQLTKRVTGATIWHVNSDESRILDYNLEFNPPSLYRPDAFRSSDHDPLLIGLELPGGKP
ncbi:ExeM/NucH family extracellular endonuclease [Microbispora sp. SCL1-1]|uniref:ExeM/NucH family extracellular endonuclease n=1 Tax=unclassified Microbispora TaxID=2614687 RepID=UPI0011591FB7|nr:MULTISPECIES: ExeM/NucH family extracellular endonuclease [unclassified Microbispora]NJP25856.1 ExeM/NucH family extracellular endonuclease [Microbispora sp. CL1-1]TQS12985.1 ExeM/NucH family extracellular endonuclease [Microbispora sp. SCL1-1]